MTDSSAEQPIMEKMAGTVFDGRGQEQHGVPMTGTPDLVDAWDAGPEDLETPIPPDADPIPVKIVQAATRQLRRTRVFHVIVPVGEVVQLLPKDDKRVSAHISCITATRGFISGERHTATPMHGYPLTCASALVSNELIVHTDEEMWVGNPDVASNLDIAVLVEYIVTEY